MALMLLVLELELLPVARQATEPLHGRRERGRHQSGPESGTAPDESLLEEIIVTEVLSPIRTPAAPLHRPHLDHDDPRWDLRSFPREQTLL